VNWNKDEGVLDTRVLAAHEARSGEPTGTFGAHRGARSKTIVPPQVVGGSVASSVEVFQESCKIHRSSLKFRSVSPFVRGFAHFHRLVSQFS